LFINETEDKLIKATRLTFLKYQIIAAISGLAMVLYFFLPQFCAYISARNWVETSCTVIETSYDTDFVGKKHSTLVLLYYVRYSYEVNNRKFFSKRCDLSRDYVSTPDYSDGMKTICYVNPNDPNDAVLNRNFPFANLTPIDRKSVV